MHVAGHMFVAEMGRSVWVTTAVVRYLGKTVDTVRHLFMDCSETV
jgi:hypothetical protein